MAKGFFGSCFVLGTCIWIGSALMLAGCNSLKIAQQNKAIHKVGLKDIVSMPPEKPKWVEVKGVPIKGSDIKKDKVGYVILMDTTSKMAAFVKLANGSKLVSNVGQQQTVMGMVQSFQEAGSLSKGKVPADVKVGNLVILENDTPPGWWSSWGLIILGFFIIGGPSSSQMQAGDKT